MPGRSRPPRPLACRALDGAAAAFILLYALLYARTLAGDATIHLVFGENAAAGRFFEFNPGEKTPSETSPGYMLLCAALFRVFPADLVPVLMKLGGIASAGLLVFWVRRVGLALLGEPVQASLAALLAAALPGSGYNSAGGMENALFAAISWAALDTVVGRGPGRPVARSLRLGALYAAAIWLRPEGVLVVAASEALRQWQRRSEGGTVRLIGLPFTMAVLGLVTVLAFHHAHTGRWFPTSALARMLVGGEPILLGPTGLDARPLLRLGAYFPLLLPAALGARQLLGRGAEAGPRALATILAALFAAVFAGLTWTGAPHLARYSIFVMPVLALFAAKGASMLWLGGRRGLALAGASMLLLIFAVETRERARLVTQPDLAGARQAPARRRQSSDQLLAQLGEAPDRARPVVVALQEVQLRYRLDARFLVRSLDGRTDEALLDFVRRSHVDHLGYLRQRNVEYLLGRLPDYGGDDQGWSLARLGALGEGGTTTRGDFTFQRRGTAVAVRRVGTSP